MRTAMPIIGLCTILCGIAVAGQPDISRYQACADRLAKAIKAADYEAVEREYNDQMRAALPLEKTREFFNGLTAQVGKLREFGAPRWEQDGLAVFPATFDKATLDMKLSLDDNGRIAGLLFVPHEEKHASLRPRAAGHESRPVQL